jgi:hypothetical protein
VLAQDVSAPHLWRDDVVLDWINDAHRQACIRGRLILEDANDDVCLIALQDGVRSYALHPCAYEIVSARIDKKDMHIVSREWLNREMPNWREDARDSRYLIQDDRRITIVGKVVDGELRMECYRLPLERMDLQSTPEIHEAHHEHLIHWALHKAFSVPDADGFDATRSSIAAMEFTRYFGALPDSDMRRITREDAVHHNVAIMP